MPSETKKMSALLVAGLAATLLLMAPANATPAWAYWYADTDGQAECLDLAEASVRRLRGQEISFKIDTYTDAMIELEVEEVDGQQVSTTALVICSERQITITVFGEDYESVEAVRDGLRDGYNEAR